MFVKAREPFMARLYELIKTYPAEKKEFLVDVGSNEMTEFQRLAFEKGAASVELFNTFFKAFPKLDLAVDEFVAALFHLCSGMQTS